MFERSRWLYISTAVLFPVLATVALAGQPPAKHVNGSLTEIDGVRVLRVWGTPEERGFAHGYLLGQDMVRVLDGLLASGRLGGGPSGYEEKVLPVLGLMKIQPQFEAEMRGLLAGIEAKAGGPVDVPCLGRSLRYEDVAAVNCTADFARMACSSFAAWGGLTEDGGTIGGRNMDWTVIPALQGTSIMLVEVPAADSGAIGWVSMTWPGYIVCTTGMNAEGVTVSMHDVYNPAPSVKTGFTPRGFALREAIESAHAKTAFDDVGRVLRKRVCAVGNNVAVTRPYASDTPAVAVFEYDGNLDDGKGVTVRKPKAKKHKKEKGKRSKGQGSRQDFLMCTNHYRERGEPTECDRYAGMNKRLRKAVKGKKPIDLEVAWEILKDVSFPRGQAQQVMTYHSVVFEPNKRLMHVAFDQDRKPAPTCRKATLDVAKLLSGAA
ncbi:MAG: hypothetical protein JXQ75_23910 [Phycisphaerae bacterium]|nr:hypothetical protein [Phycisphaerae bacterium]